jgi:HEPN domain-containing protein
MSLEEARKAFERAKAQYDKAAVDAWEPAEPDNAVMWAFYAYENAVIAVAELKGIPWEKNHAKKATLARELHATAVLRTDVSDRLRELNEMRKDVAYDEPGPELRELSLEKLIADLEAFIDEVEGLIESHGENS